MLKFLGEINSSNVIKNRFSGYCLKDYYELKT